MLPRVNHRIVRTKMPSDGRDASFRPMTGREEKLLLIAKETRDDDEILTTVRQVCQSCLMDDLDLDEVPLVDVEWLFVQIRIASVGPEAPVSYIDGSDGKRYDFVVDLNDVKAVVPPLEKFIKVTDEVALEVSWPGVLSYVRPEVIDAPTEIEIAHQLAVESIRKVYSGDEVHDIKNYAREEVDELVSSLDGDSYQKLLEIVGSSPHLEYRVQYVNSKGEEREVILKNLTDFFMFR